ncbi:50S ribosomal protein L9 [Candidatus Gracilibacteria bacterium]|nr:50S ribosomal protein L9 [Candidatus Gracilibacteria bacterium]
MKVLFLENVINVAKKGDIKEVSPGYAANMLIPKGLAKELTPQAEKEYKDQIKKDQKHRQELIENRHKIAEKLQGIKLEFQVKTGAGDKVYGGIGEKDIIRKIKAQYKVELGKKHIFLNDGHIKKLGETQAFIKLGKDAKAKIFITLFAEK